jgi:16S rRNA (uracil1498-N3)-methyltransferase
MTTRMAIHDATSQRLFVSAPLAAAAAVACSDDQANYLRAVMRAADGAPVRVFNGRDGEWLAEVLLEGRRGVSLRVVRQTRPQVTGPDLTYLFAPLKRARLDYMVQKATELGVARLSPVMTRHTVAERVNGERMRANAIEAAEQCGVLRVPDVDAPIKLETALAAWDSSRRLIFCDEAADVAGPLAVLSRLAPGPLAVLIGPEGGFAPDERRLLLAQPFVTALSLGPRVMRADTAAVAALALVNATLGDWHQLPAQPSPVTETP